MFLLYIALIVISSMLLISCTSVSDLSTHYETEKSTELPRFSQNRRVKLSTRHDFDPLHYDGLVLGHIEIRETHGNMHQDSSEHEILKTLLKNRLQPMLTGTITQGLRMEIILYNIKPVTPALNVLSTAALLLPLDRGSLTMQIKFYDSKGKIQAIRTENITGNPMNITGAFSRYSRLMTALDLWIAECGVWPTCLTVKETSAK